MWQQHHTQPGSVRFSVALSKDAVLRAPTCVSMFSFSSTNLTCFLSPPAQSWPRQSPVRTRPRGTTAIKGVKQGVKQVREDSASQASQQHAHGTTACSGACVCCSGCSPLPRLLPRFSCSNRQPHKQTQHFTNMKPTRHFKANTGDHMRPFNGRGSTLLSQPPARDIPKTAVWN